MRHIVIAVQGTPLDVRDLEQAVARGDAVIVSQETVPTQAANPPGLLQKAANFAASAARHVAAGMPMASEEEVVRRFAICQGCEQFDGKACRLCGCPVVREKQFVSKLSWAGESCPAGKWGPVDAAATVERERKPDADDRPPLPPER